MKTKINKTRIGNKGVPLTKNWKDVEDAIKRAKIKRSWKKESDRSWLNSENKMGITYGTDYQGSVILGYSVKIYEDVGTYPRTVFNERFDTEQEAKNFVEKYIGKSL